MPASRQESLKNVDLDATFDGTLNPRTDQMPPNELLNFYRQTIASFKTETDSFQGQLDKIAEAINEQADLQKKLSASEAANFELQEKCSRFEGLLYKERIHVFRLYAENDRLKLHELDASRRIEGLLKMAGVTTSEAAIFMPREDIYLTDVASITAVTNETNEPPSARRGVVVNPTQPLHGTVECTLTGFVRRVKTGGLGGNRLLKTHDEIRNQAAVWDLQWANETIAALRKQLDEQKVAAEDHIASLCEDQERRRKDGEEFGRRLAESEECLRNQLQKCQKLLQESANEHLHKMEQYRLAEKLWISEKEHLIARCGDIKGLVSNRRGPPKSSLSRGRLVSTASTSHLDGTARREEELRKIIQDLELQFDQQHQLAAHYHEQALQAEDSLNCFREESRRCRQEFAARTKKLNEQLQVYIQRCNGLERRRKLEIEGYSTDIASLKKKLSDTVKRQEQDLQERGPIRAADESGLAVLQKMHKGTLRSRVLAGELVKLKHFIYSLEDDVRAL